MTENIIRQNNGFTLIELLIVIVIIGILAAVAVPMYTRHITNAKAAEALHGLSTIMTYVKSYRRAHGEYPPIPADTRTQNGEWIDEVVGGANKYFRYEYGILFKDGNPWLVKVSAEGQADPFRINDILIFNFIKQGNTINSWEAIEVLEDIKPS